MDNDVLCVVRISIYYYCVCMRVLVYCAAATVCDGKLQAGGPRRCNI